MTLVFAPQDNFRQFHQIKERFERLKESNRCRQERIKAAQAPTVRINK